MFALKGPDISSELAILELLHSTDINTLPLFTDHLRAHSSVGLPFSQVAVAEAAAAAAGSRAATPAAHSSKSAHPANAQNESPGETSLFLLSCFETISSWLDSAEAIIPNFHSVLFKAGNFKVSWYVGICLCVCKVSGASDESMAGNTQLVNNKTREKVSSWIRAAPTRHDFRVPHICWDRQLGNKLMTNLVALYSILRKSWCWCVSL